MQTITGNFEQNLRTRRGETTTNHVELTLEPFLFLFKEITGFHVSTARSRDAHVTSNRRTLRLSLKQKLPEKLVISGAN